MSFSCLRGPFRPFLLAAGLASAAQAQEIIPDRYYVTASPLGATGPATVGSTSVRSQLPVDVGALLTRELPEVAPIRRGGVATDLLLRGFGRDNVNVTLDGAPAYCACPGRMDPPVFHVSSPLVERIAVYPGPFDVRVGSTPGGAIAVESAPPPDVLAATAGVLAGSADLFAADAAIGGPLGGGTRALLAGSHQQGRSYRDGDGNRVTALPGLNYRPEWRDRLAFTIDHAEAQLRCRAGAGELAFNAALNDANDVLYPALLMDAQRDRSSRAGLGWRGNRGSGLLERWRIDGYHLRVEHDMSDAFRSSSLGMWSSRGYMMRTQATATNYGAKFEAEGLLADVRVTQGVQIGARNWTADNVIGPNRNSMLPDVTVSNAAWYAQSEHRAGPWRLRAGVRIDAWRSEAARNIDFVQRAWATTRNRQTDGAATGFALVERRWSDTGAVFGGIGHGARLPDPQERYISVDRPAAGTDWVGNPGLDVVRATELTAGAREQFGAIRFSARAFHSRIDDYIVLGRLTPAAGSGANPSRTESYFGIGAEITGLEAMAECSLGGSWSVAAGAAGQVGRKRSFAPGDTDRDLPEMPPWRGRTALRWQRERGWFELEGQWAARQSHVDAGAGEGPIGGFGVAHARAEFRLGQRWLIGVGVDNLFDRQYATHNAYTRDPFAAGLILPEPGRFAHLRLRWTL